MKLSDLIKKKIRSCAMWAVIMLTCGVWSLSDYALGFDWFNDLFAAVSFVMAGVWMTFGWSYQSSLDAIVRVEQSIDDLKQMVDEQRKEKDE